jgi:hypothetical protein
MQNYCSETSFLVFFSLSILHMFALRASEQFLHRSFSTSSFCAMVFINIGLRL